MTSYDGGPAVRIVYIGTTELGVPALRLLNENPGFEVVGVVTQPDKPAGRGLKLKAPAVKTAALELGLKLMQPESLKNPEAIGEIRDLKPDVIATAAYGLWIPDEVFDMTPKRCLNLHPSLLPRHRGAAPVVSTILADESEVGISVLFVEDEMDAGDILAQIKLPIEKDETTESVMKRCAVAGGPFFVETIYRWMNNDITPVPQDHDKQTWFGRMEKSEGLIDWNLPATEIARRCRALTPWPGIYTFFNGKRLLIHRALVLENGSNIEYPKEPGRVIRSGSKVGIITGDGILIIELLQLTCRKKQNIRDFINGNRSFINTKLG